MSKYYQNKKNEFYCWSCDFSKNSGEGNLANLFVERLKIFKKNIKVYNVDRLNIKIKIIKKFLDYKYVSPFVGIFFCWFFFFKKKKVVYINYLPLWNFLLFAFLPPKTILGPITGGAKFSRNYQYLSRKYIFFIFYKISEIFLIIRNQKINFATDLLKEKLWNYTILKSKFNYIFLNIKKRERKKKHFDFLIYYRRHKNKNISFPYDLIKKLITLNFKIIVVGDRLKISGVKNLGYVSNTKVNQLLSKTFFSISSNENPYSLFNIECINNHVKIIAKSDQKKEINFLKKSFIFLNYDKLVYVKNILRENKKN